MSKLQGRKLIALLAGGMLLSLLLAAAAPATCGGGGGGVPSFYFTAHGAATHNVGNTVTLTIVNNSNDEWTVTSEGTSTTSGTFDKLSSCLGQKRAPGGSCSIQVNCTKAGVLDWWVRVEGTGIPFESELAGIKCDA